MFHRFFLRRFLFLLLIGGLLFGGARALFGAGYRQGFVQGSMMAAGDGQAVTVAPEAAFRAMTHWGMGPLGTGGGGFPLLWLGVGFLALLFMGGACRRHGPDHRGPHAWAHGHGHPRHGWGHTPAETEGIGPEKQPTDFV